AALGHADDVVHLHFAARADAEIALDAGVEIDRHGGMAAVGRGLVPRRQPALGNAHAIRPEPEARAGIVALRALRLVRDQELEHHLPREFCPLARGLDLHAVGGLADAGSRQHALALDLHHAGAAVAIGTVAGRGAVAEMRDLGALPLCYLPNG